MKRRVLVAIAALVLVSLGSTASAAPASTQLNEQVSGSFTGGWTFGFSIVGTYETSRGVGELTLIGPAEWVDGTFDLRWSGNFVLTTPSGAVLRGTFSGTISETGQVQLTLTVQTGTRRFRRTSGTIEFSAQLASNPADPSVSRGLATGTLSGMLIRT